MSQSISTRDQGAVYSSISFNQAFLNSNIIRSMSRAGTPTDNPVIESMNGWIKAQIKCDYNINEYESIYDFIKEYVHYYNYERPMYKLNYHDHALKTWYVQPYKGIMLLGLRLPRV